MAEKEGPRGAILQRDKQTYAIVPRTPVGLIKPEQLEAIATVVMKYNIPVIKITSGQRLALVGMKQLDVIIEVSPADAFDLTGVTITLGAEMAPGVWFPLAGQCWVRSAGLCLFLTFQRDANKWAWTSAGLRHGVWPITPTPLMVVSFPTRCCTATSTQQTKRLLG